MTSLSRRFTLGTSLALMIGLGGASAVQGASNRQFTKVGGSFEIKPSAGSPVIGDDGRIGVMVILQGEPAAKEYQRALKAAGGRGPVAEASAGAASTSKSCARTCRPLTSATSTGR